MVCAQSGLSNCNTCSLTLYHVLVTRCGHFTLRSQASSKKFETPLQQLAMLSFRFKNRFFVELLVRLHGTSLVVS